MKTNKYEIDARDIIRMLPIERLNNMNEGSFIKTALFTAKKEDNGNWEVDDLSGSTLSVTNKEFFRNYICKSDPFCSLSLQEIMH